MLKNEFLKKYPYKTELHAHSLPVSKCSEFYAQELVDLYSAEGVNTVVLTNHFTYEHIKDRTKDSFVKEYVDSFRALKECAEAKGMNAIFGMELRFTETSNDYLVYGITEADVPVIYDYVVRGLECFYKEFKRDGVLILQAHPGRDRMTAMDYDLLDGVEAFNMHPGHNPRAALVAQQANAKGKIIVGGSDFHHPNQVGLCLMRTKAPVTAPDELVRAITSGDYVLDVCGSVILP